MKKLLLFAATAALFFACTPENPSDDTPSGDTTVKVIGVSVDKTVELRVGETVTLKAVVTPGNASDKSVSWSSDKEDIATVDQSGKVTAKAKGTATVTVKTNDGGKTAECWVVVKAPVAVTETQKAKGVTPTTAVLGGYLNLEKPYPGDLVVGVQYSKSADMPKSGTTTAEFTLDTENKYFEGRVLDLEPGTTYYYRSFADTGGKENHGEIMTLTTGSLESLIKTLDATEIGGTHATFNCSLYEQVSAYMRWYKNSVFSYGFYFQDKFVEKGLIVDARNFSKVVSDLAEKTTYSYKAFVKFGDKIYYGEAKKFTTGTAVTGVTLNNKTAALEVGSSCTLVPTVAPYEAADKSVYWTTSDSDIVTVDETGKVTAVALGSAYIYAISNDTSERGFCKVNVCRIDGNLGLSVTWATSNLSETGLCAKPHDYGDYYAWGETASKDKPSWANYKWCNGSYNTLTKYNIKISYGNLPDGRKVLVTGLRGDDAASKILGGKWRMPTVEDYDELWEKCTWEWVEGFGESGVKGLLITGLNKNSIFLPAAGERWEKGLSSENTYGRYWSSNLDVNKPSYAQRLTFSFMETRTMDSIDRYYGFSIRPVKSN